MRTLTRDEARARAALIRVESYDVHLDLRLDDGFDSEVTVRFSCAEPGASTFIELDGELGWASLNGREVAGALDGNRLALDNLKATNELRVEARCDYSRTGEGLHRFVDPADGLVYAWGQSFLDDAQRIFACFDQPDLKATFTLTVRAPTEWTVIGNAEGTGERGRWSFEPTERMSTYLFTVAAGPWHSAYAEGSPRLGLHCRRSLAPYLDADELLPLTARMMTLQQDLFGRAYPFGATYDQLFVPEFNHGAMENAGAVTFTEDHLFRSRVTEDERRERAEVIAHEMAHMWFGDLVTMRWWDDLWLNESFAELMGFVTVERATDFEGTWAACAVGRKIWGYRADQLPSTHPVRGDVADTQGALSNFDGISYAKGAAVLRQLMATVGEGAFFGGLRAYMAQYAFGNTGFVDLLAQLETASGRDLTEWARVWLGTSGVSTLRVVDGAIRQSADVLRPQRIDVDIYDRTGDSLVLRERRDVELLDAMPLLVAPPADLVLPNATDSTFAKLRLDPRSLATAVTDLRRLEEPLARAVVWSALWDACRDGELPVHSYVEAVLANVHGEPDPAVVASVLGQARIAVTSYCTDGGPLLARLSGSSWAAVHASAGTDLQLTHVRAWAAATDDTAALRALLDGSDVPAGLEVDKELRWRLLDSLAVLGGADTELIGAELARDTTAAGIRHAHRARAGRPEQATKHAAWVAATTDESLSNHDSQALAEGFWRAGQDELLTPYVRRYVDEMPDVFATRSPQVGRELALQLFPHTLVTAETMEATARLEDRRQPEVLRRIVVERRDDLARALRVRGRQ